MVGPRGLALIKRFEGCRLEAYLDSKGVPTIGWGHTDGVVMGDTCTQEQADRWLVEDVAWADDAVSAAIYGPVSESMRDALISWTYNLGAANLNRSRMGKAVNARQYLDAAQEMTRWWHTKGSELGLLRRRLAEASLFLEDDLPR